jgi:hypothetical protein
MAPPNEVGEKGQMMLAQNDKDSDSPVELSIKNPQINVCRVRSSGRSDILSRGSRASLDVFSDHQAEGRVHHEIARAA